MSHEALGLLEEQFLFAPYRPLKASGSDFPGVITRENQLYGDNNLVKHSLLMGAVYWLTATMFLVLVAGLIGVRLGCIQLPLPSALGR